MCGHVPAGDPACDVAKAIDVQRCPPLDLYRAERMGGLADDQADPRIALEQRDLPVAGGDVEGEAGAGPAVPDRRLQHGTVCPMECQHGVDRQVQ